MRPAPVSKIWWTYYVRLILDTWRIKIIMFGVCVRACVHVCQTLRVVITLNHWTQSFDMSHVYTVLEELLKYTKLYELDL